MAIRIHAWFVVTLAVASPLLPGCWDDGDEGADPDLQSGLVGHWKFDEVTGAAAADSSGNGNDGAVNGAAWLAGKVDGALRFDGGDDYVYMPSSPDLGGSSFTLACWIYREGGSERKIVDKWNDYTGNFQFEFQVYTDNTLWLSVRQSDDTQCIARGTTVIETGRWYHVAAVADIESSELSVYVNGVKDVLQSDPGWDGTVNSVEMEMCVGRKCTAQHYWHGVIDDVRIYDRVLGIEDVRTLFGPHPPEATSDEVWTPTDAGVDLDVLANDTDPNVEDTLSVSSFDAASAQGGTVTDLGGGVLHYEPPAGFSGTDTFSYTVTDGRDGFDTATVTVWVGLDGGLVAHWKLDETSGVIAYDSSGNGHDGTVNGATWAAGRVNGALDFDGAGDYVGTGKTASDLGIGGSAAKTICAWVYTRAFNGGGVFEVGWGSTGNEFSLRTLGSANAWRVQFWGTADIDFTYDSQHKWVHLAVTYDGEVGRAWADGTEVASKAVLLDTVDVRPLAIGKWETNYFDGVIDDVRLYGRALGAAELCALATCIPTVDAGPDQTITFPVDTAVLNATVVDDGLTDPSHLTATWEKVSGLGTVIFGDASAIDTTATFASVGVYVLRLTVDDGDGNVVSDEVTVLVIDPSLPTVSLAATDPDAAEEGPDPGTITVSRTGDTTAPLTVLYSASGSADPSDYTPSLSGEVTIGAGQASADIVVTPVDDDTDEGRETLTLTIVSAAQYNVDMTSSAADVSILDDDIVLSNGLVAYWRFDETSGTVAVDSSGCGHDGTLANGPVWTPGIRGGCLSFDGSDDYASFGSLSIAGSAPRSIAGWVKANSTTQPDWTGVFGFTPDSGSNATYFDLEVDNLDRYCIHMYGTELTLCNVDTEWHHIAATYDGTTVRCYLDGAEVTSINIALATIDDFVIGRRVSFGRYFNGLVDDVRVHDRALTAGEVRLLATGVPIVDAGPDQDVFAADLTATLDGTVLDEEGPGGCTTIWTVVSGPSSVTFGDAAAIDTSVTFDSPGPYVLRLTADDGMYVVTDDVAIIMLDPTLPVVAVHAIDGRASEQGPDPGAFEFSRTGSTATALTVHYEVSGSATDDDYVETLTGVVTIPPGSASATVSVTPLADGNAEGPEVVRCAVAWDYAVYGPDPTADDAAVLIVEGAAPLVVWVDTDGDDDLGDGTRLAPYASLGRALSDAGQNWVVVVNPGVYVTHVGLKGNGHSGLTITGAGDPDQTVLRGSGDQEGTLINYQRAPNVTLRNVTLENANTALIIDFNGTACHVTNCILRDMGGGAIYSNGGVFKVTSCWFDNCQMGGDHHNGVKGTYVNSLFTNCGNGVHVITPSTATLTMTNDTLTGCGTAVNYQSFGGSSIRNCIMAYNSVGVRYNTYADPPDVGYCNVYGNTTADYTGLTDQTGINGNISVPPEFLGPGDYRIAATSGCRDAGTNDVSLPPTDFAGAERVVGGIVDIGCHECQN